MSNQIQSVKLITFAVFLEMLRRREFYVVLLFMGLFIIGIIIMRIVGVQNEATASFLLNLGMSLAYFFSIIITLLTAARQFPDEMEQRTIYPLLAKPLERGSYIIGKWLASALVGIGILLLLVSMACIPVPRLMTYSGLLFAQTIFLQISSLVMLSAITLWGSLHIPKILNCVLVGLLIFLAPKLLNFASAKYDNPIIYWIINYIPNLDVLNTITNYSSGGNALIPTDFILRIIYAAIITMFFLTITVKKIGRKTL